MNDPVKFLFDDSFDIDEKAAKKRELEAITNRLRAEFEIELEQAKEQAFSEGFQEGEKKAMNSNEVALKHSTEELNQTNSKLVKALEILLDSSDTMMEAYKQRAREYREYALQLSLAVSKRIAGKLVELQPHGSLEKMFRETINYLDDELRVSVSVPHDLVQESQERMQAIADEHGYSGRIIIVDDKTVKQGDWKIEWSSGGITRDGQEIDALIEDTVKRFLEGVDVKLFGEPPVQDNENWQRDGDA